jgi:hypothetical protein
MLLSAQLAGMAWLFNNISTAWDLPANERQ